MQLEVGEVATPFEHRSYGQELVLCQRYFEKSYDVANAPGSIVNTGCVQAVASTSYILSSGYVRYATPKRSTPTVSFYSTQDGVAGKMAEYNIAGAFVANRDATLVSQSGETGFWSQVNGNATVGNSVRYQWTASAEL